MKANNLIFLVLLVAMLGCNQDDENLQTLNGTYIGIFERDGEVADVELTLDNGTYQGQGEHPKFPAICRGTYTLSGNKITFVNTCAWTANFDWTLILSGEWQFALNNKVLIMTNAAGDRYTLNRQ